MLQCYCLYFPGCRVSYLWLKSCNDLYMPFKQWKFLQFQWEQSQCTNFMEWQNVGKSLPISSIFHNEAIYFLSTVASNARGTSILLCCLFFFLYLQWHVFYPIYEYSSEWLLFWKHCSGILMRQTDSKPSQMEKTVVVPLTWGGARAKSMNRSVSLKCCCVILPLPFINCTLSKALTILCCELGEYPDCG